MPLSLILPALLETGKRFTVQLTLSIACGYIERLLSNARIEKHLDKHHRDILAELRSLLSEVKPQKAKGAAEGAG